MLGLQAAYAVKLKIDNLNLEDMFDVHRLKNLISLFTHRLWKESLEDIQLARQNKKLVAYVLLTRVPSLTGFHRLLP